MSPREPRPPRQREPAPNPERLQKILSRAGFGSRRQAEELIREGRVEVNGQPAELGQSADPHRDAIRVDGKRIQLPEGPRRTFLAYKPKGVMCTRSDPQGRPTVMDLLPPALRTSLVPVGRLDFHTEGLILLTEDGELAQRVAHPRYGCTKTYEVKVKGLPRAEQLDRLRRGMVLDGKKLAPVKVSTMESPGQRPSATGSWFQVELGEGRTRQIREMFFRIGHPVQKLRRVGIGPLRDARLEPGAVRELSQREVEALRRSTRSAKAGSGSSRDPQGPKGGGKAPGWAKAGSSRKKPRRSVKKLGA